MLDLRSAAACELSLDVLSGGLDRADFCESGCVNGPPRCRKMLSSTITRDLGFIAKFSSLSFS